MQWLWSTIVVAEMRQRRLTVPGRLVDVVVAYRWAGADPADMPDEMLGEIAACMQTGRPLPNALDDHRAEPAVA